MAGEVTMWDSSLLDALTENGSPITYGVVKPGAEGDVPFVRGGDITGGRVLINQLRTITRDISQQYRRTLLRGGEILVSLVGNPGQIAIAPPSLVGANIARQVGLIRLKPGVDSRFISYFLQSPVGQKTLGARSLGSVQQVINLRDLKTVKVPLPPLPEQRRIAHILGTLDDKIENNRKTAKTLEAMAQAIFKSWFVDFDPVRAKMNGESPESICKRLKLTPEILDLFPDRLVDSELGEIPEGWNPIVLSKLFIERKERDVTGLLTEYSSTNDGVIPRGLIFNKSISTQYVPNKVIHFGDFVFGLSRKVLNFGLMTDTLGSVSPAYRVFSIMDGTVNPVIIEKLIRANHSYYYQVLSAGSREGQSISLDSFSIICLPSIPDKIQIAYLSISDFILMVKKPMDLQVLALIKIRDTLLPKLISGEVRIPEAQNLIKSAMERTNEQI